MRAVHQLPAARPARHLVEGGAQRAQRQAPCWAPCQARAPAPLPAGAAAPRPGVPSLRTWTPCPSGCAAAAPPCQAALPSCSSPNIRTNTQRPPPKLCRRRPTLDKVPSWEISLHRSQGVQKLKNPWIIIAPLRRITLWSNDTCLEELPAFTCMLRDAHLDLKRSSSVLQFAPAACSACRFWIWAFSSPTYACTPT